MVYDIILGREEKDRQKYGTQGTLLLGKHYVTMAQETTLAQNIYLDITKPHVIFVCGKRSTGKSYSLGVIAEGIYTQPREIAQKLSVIMLDTMGIYWTMKYPNNQDAALLKEWGLKPSEIDVKIYTPSGFFKDYKKKGIPTDFEFSMKPSELSPEDWWLAFSLVPNEPIAVFIERIILTLAESKKDFEIKDILKEIKEDKKEDPHVRNAAENRFIAAEKWGVFSKEATSIKELVKGGQITILDMSPYAVMPNGWQIKNLVIGIICRKLFIERMLVRKDEEFESIHSAIHYISEEKDKREMPIIWLLLDEAHEMLPSEGKTSATDALITLLREGRQPGIALVLATQQPGKIHTDAMTQSDVIISHRLTARIDTDALGNLMQSYLRQGLDKELNILPRVSGAALAIDDVNERIYPMRIRPKFSWHGGGSPGIIEQKKKLFE